MNDLPSMSSRRKLALIVGISNYARQRCLPNAIHDANDMTKTLKDIGFKIHDNQLKLDLTCREMRHVLIDFEHLIKEGDLVLFYFARHGIQ